MIDPKAAYGKLRASTAAMLGLGDELSQLQTLQIDLLSLLRLSVDSLQGRALAGEDVDLAQLADALTMLQKLLPEAALQARVSPEQEEMPEHEASAAVLELEKLLAGYDAARRREMAANPELVRQAFEAELAAATAEFAPDQTNTQQINSAATPAIEPPPPQDVPPPAVKIKKAAPPAPAPAREPSTTEKYLEWSRNGGGAVQWPGSPSTRIW